MKYRGFTLIEVLISAALLGLVGLVLMTTLNSSTSLKGRLQKSSQRVHLARQAMARMGRELSMAYVSGHVHPSNPVVETQFRGESQQVSFVAFGHVLHQKNARQSDQRELTYFISKDENTGETTLFRKEKINPAKQMGQEGNAQVLCPFVQSIEFAYFDDKLGRWESDWKTDGGLGKLVLPSRVRIKMVVKMESGEDQIFWSQASIWLINRISVK